MQKDPDFPSSSPRQISALDIHLHSASEVILQPMFSHVDIFYFHPLAHRPPSLKSRMKWLKDEMLLDMINKLQTGVNVCRYTHTRWPTLIDYSQCDATRNITMLIQSALTWCAMSEKRERVQTIKTVWVWGGGRPNAWLCLSAITASLCARLSVPMSSL